MKIKILLSLLASLIITISVSAGDGKPAFAGNWKLDRTKSSTTGSSLFLSAINIKVENDNLLTERVYENSNGENYPFNENLTLDNKEYKIEIYEMPRKSKAQWSEKDNSLSIESNTTYNGNSGEQIVNTIETWKLSQDGNQLIYDFVTKTSEGSIKGIYYFNKSK
jgi:hypothetical protein